MASHESEKNTTGEGPSAERMDFIRSIVVEDRRTGKWDGRVHTRFPPEPNGYLHIGHAKSICLNFGIAAEFGGKCNLRFDDTNPTKEEQEYVDSIIDDVRWLGWDWEDRLFFASDYFEQMYDWAVQLIKKGKAYVCDLTAEEIRRVSRHADRARARTARIATAASKKISTCLRGCEKGEFPDGSRTLRAKIDMAHPEYQHARPGDVPHPARHRITAPATSGASIRCTTGRTGWRIPSRASRIRSARWNSKITGRCTTGSSTQLGIYHPQQIEFARLNLTYTVMSKRKLLQLVQEKHRQRLGRSADADDLAACGGAGIRPRRSAISARSSASTNSTARSMSPCWSIACAKTSTRPRRA